MGECGGLGFGEGLGVNSLDFRQPYCKVVKATLIPLLQEDKSTGYSKLIIFNFKTYENGHQIIIQINYLAYW